MQRLYKCQKHTANIDTTQVPNHVKNSHKHCN